MYIHVQLFAEFCRCFCLFIGIRSKRKLRHGMVGSIIFELINKHEFLAF